MRSVGAAARRLLVLVTTAAGPGGTSAVYQQMRCSQAALFHKMPNDHFHKMPNDHDVGCLGWSGATPLFARDANPDPYAASAVGTQQLEQQTPGDRGILSGTGINLAVRASSRSNAAAGGGGWGDSHLSYYGGGLDVDGRVGFMIDRGGSGEEEVDGLEEAFTLAEALYREARERGDPNTPWARVLAEKGRK